MDPKFQRMYSDLREGKFEGGIDYVEGETRLIGKTSDGQDIDLMLKDFEQHLPSVLTSGGNITSKLSATKQTYKAQHDAYLKDPKNNPLPVYDVDLQASTIATEIGKMGDDGLKRYGVDVLNYSVEDIDNMVDAYQTGKKEVPLRRKMGDRTYNALTPAQQARFKPDGSTLNKSEAMLYVADDLAKEQANIELTYLQEGTNYLKPHTPQRVQDPLFIQQADQGYQNKEGSFTIDDITIEDDKYAPGVKDFIEKDEIITITKAGAEDKEGVAFPDKTIEIDLTNSDDVLKYITGPDYMRYASGQSEERLANKKAIIRANEIAKENIAKRNKRRKEEASEASKEKNQFRKYFPENSFGGGLNEDGLPNS